MDKDLQLLEERFVSREDIFEGRLIHVVKDTVSLPDGHLSTREVMLHRGAVAVVPLFEDGTVLMEKQYRYAQGRVVYEIPAGKLEEGEEDLVAVCAREMREETGLVAERYTPLGFYVPSPAILGERIALYLAEGLRLGESALDEGEFLLTDRRPLSELIEMILAGKIEDGKTQVALLKTYLLRKNK